MSRREHDPAAVKPVLFEVVPSASLRPARRAEILALCSDAYEEDFTVHLDRLAQATHLLARVDGLLVGHAAWIARELRAGNVASPLRAAYVEAVAVPKRRQGLGFGSRLLAAVPERLAAFEIAALSPSLVPFYERLGWKSWRGPLRYAKDDVRFATPDEDVMIHRLARTPATLDLDATLETDWRPGEVW